MEPRRLGAIGDVLIATLIQVFLLTGCHQQDDESRSREIMSSVGADPYCFNRTQFDFCEDFDTDELPGVFEEQSVREGVLRISEEQASSPPSSLFVSVNSGGKEHVVLDIFPKVISVVGKRAENPTSRESGDAFDVLDPWNSVR